MFDRIQKDRYASCGKILVFVTTDARDGIVNAIVSIRAMEAMIEERRIPDYWTQKEALDEGVLICALILETNKLTPQSFSILGEAEDKDIQQSIREENYRPEPALHLIPEPSLSQLPNAIRA